MNLVDDLNSVRRGALLRTHLHQLAVLLLRFDQQSSFSGVMAARLLHIDMLSGLQAGDGHGRMPVFGRGDGDDVHIPLLKNIAEVADHGRTVAEFLLGAVGVLLEDVGVHIDHMRDSRRLPVGAQRGEMRIGAAIEADDGKVETIVGTENLPITFRAGGNRQSSRSEDKCVNKIASSDHCFLRPFSGCPRPLGDLGKHEIIMIRY